MSEYSLEQQKLIIESLLSSPDLYTRAQNIIKPEYFATQFRRSVHFIQDFANQFRAMPSTVQIAAETGFTYELIQEIPNEHKEYFLDLIEGFCKHQAITEAIIKGSELLEKGDYSSIEPLLKEALTVGLQKEIGIDYFKDPKERLKHMLESNGQMSTGWLTVDQKLYKVNRGELLIFAAPSGGGKSVALQNLTVNLALQNLNVIYITLELSENLCAMRMDSMITGIKSSEIFKRIEDLELIVKTTGKKSGCITIKKLKSESRCLDLRAYLKEFQIQKGYKPDAVIIDYLDLMMPNDKRVSPSDLFVKDKFVSQELRALAEEFNYFCATAAQLGRSAVDASEFNHAHISGGISKIQTCDNAIGIFNSARARERGEIEFQLLKTRNSGGVDQKIILSYNPETLRITDMDESTITVNSRSVSAGIMDKINKRAQEAPIKVNPETGEITEVEVIKPADPIARAASLKSLINKSKGY